jgi:hypothetical protein
MYETISLEWMGRTKKKRQVRMDRLGERIDREGRRAAGLEGRVAEEQDRSLRRKGKWKQYM